MQVTILGGGNEVGASCLYIEMAGTKLIVDAGMRMHGDNPLPALGLLEGKADVDAILVTHAHADHIGALPIIHSLYPQSPIYATPPTVDLMNIMMRDSFKILEQRCRETNGLPPYTEEQVNHLLQSLLLFPASGKLQIGNVTIHSYRAGHILGAVMFLIEGGGETLFITGDLSFKAGRTINGAEVPHDVQPDVLIMESTYGNRTHTDRNTEEKRLAQDVAEVIAAGGFALIPAFALGRAQEVLLVLQDYMEKGLIPEFPIYVDGLVTPISKIYNRYPHFLKGPVAYRIKNNGDAFLTEGRCKAVHPKEREAVLQGKPGCIVASSGMLIGGASSWYAQKLVADEKNAIFITGYQDEESPGKKLLNIADGINNELELAGTKYEVKCRVGKYGLSAHADASEMNRFVQTLQPTYTLLVHGDDSAREQLSQVLDPKYHPVLVENGESYPFEKRGSGKGLVGKRYSRQVDASLAEKVGSLLLYQKETDGAYKLAICTSVHAKTNTLVCQTLKGKQVKLTVGQVREVIGYWNRSIHELQEAGEVLGFSRPYLEQVEWSRLPDGRYFLQEIFQTLAPEDIKCQIAIAMALQSLPKDHVEQGEGGTCSYMLDEEMKQRLATLNLPIQGIRVNPAYAMERVRTQLADHPRFIRCGADYPGTEREQMTIYFDFPDVVSEEERQDIASTIRRETGWPVVFSDSVRQDLLQAELAKLIGHLGQTPSIHLNERKIAVAMDLSTVDPALLAQFKSMTGFEVLSKGSGTASSQAPVDDALFQAATPSPRMENNQAIEEAKRWAVERGITMYKASMKQQGGMPLMEVHFISPQIARQHETDLTELSYRIGMPVTYAKAPKQNEIIRLTLEVLPESWSIKKNPSLHTDKAVVAVKVNDMPPKDEIEQAQAAIQQATGYTLDIQG
ncbi:MAG: MBL fold metallo-hydrolase [Lysinibacillus sp.]